MRVRAVSLLAAGAPAGVLAAAMTPSISQADNGPCGNCGRRYLIVVAPAPTVGSDGRDPSLHPLSAVPADAVWLSSGLIARYSWLAVITTRTADGLVGMTASAVALLQRWNCWSRSSASASSFRPARPSCCLGISCSMPSARARNSSATRLCDLPEGQSSRSYAARRAARPRSSSTRSASVAVGGTLPGGDHTIVVGSVLACDQSRNEPLACFASSFGRLCDRSPTPGTPSTGSSRRRCDCPRAQSAVVVRTRLRPPVAHPDHVRRSRLLARLDAVREPVIVVAAPRGAGKTVLLAQWVARGPNRPGDARG